MKIFKFLKPMNQVKLLVHNYVVMAIGFALNHDKSLQIYFCQKQLSERCQKQSHAKNDFLKDVKSRISISIDKTKKTV